MVDDKAKKNVRLRRISLILLILGVIIFAGFLGVAYFFVNGISAGLYPVIPTTQNAQCTSTVTITVNSTSSPSSSSGTCVVIVDPTQAQTIVEGDTSCVGSYCAPSVNVSPSTNSTGYPGGSVWVPVTDVSSYCNAFRAFFNVYYCVAQPGGGGSTNQNSQYTGPGGPGPNCCGTWGFALVSAFEVVAKPAGPPTLLISLAPFGFRAYADIRLAVLVAIGIILILQFFVAFIFLRYEKKNRSG